MARTVQDVKIDVYRLLRRLYVMCQDSAPEFAHIRKSCDREARQDGLTWRDEYYFRSYQSIFERWLQKLTEDTTLQRFREAAVKAEVPPDAISYLVGALTQTTYAGARMDLFRRWEQIVTPPDAVESTIRPVMAIGVSATVEFAQGQIAQESTTIRVGAGDTESPCILLSVREALRESLDQAWRNVDVLLRKEDIPAYSNVGILQALARAMQPEQDKADVATLALVDISVANVSPLIYCHNDGNPARIREGLLQAWPKPVKLTSQMFAETFFKPKSVLSPEVQQMVADRRPDVDRIEIIQPGVTVVSTTDVKISEKRDDELSGS